MKKAFTMLELVFVIVVIGILAAAILPSIKSTSDSEATIHLQSQIRYVQHLAMVNDRFDASNSTWMANRWRIEFSGTNNTTYSIVRANINDGAIGTPIYAKDPLNNTDMKDINLADKYHITDIAFISASGNVDGSCQGKTSISFDHLGRPMVGDINSTTTAYTSANLMKEECTIAINHNNPDAPVLKIGMDTTSIRLHPETGYAHIIKVGS